MKRHGAMIATYALLGLAVAFVALPLLWMMATSFKTNQVNIMLPPEWLPIHVTGSHYTKLLTEPYFLGFLRNSLIVATTTTVISLILATLAGYGFSRFSSRLNRPILMLILATQMFPSVVLLISLYLLFSRMDLVNTYSALVMAFSSFALPFSVWMLKGFFDTIPKDLEDAAYIDGCGRLDALRKIILPLSGPGLAATALFTFLVAWDEYLFALTLTSSTSMRPLSVGMILSYVSQFQYRWGDMMAAAIVVSIPVTVLFILGQRYLVQGLTAGAVKG